MRSFVTVVVSTLGLAAAFKVGVQSKDSCVVEWGTCSPDDDNALPCCAGTYCWVQDAYYAQCRLESGPVPSPAPVLEPTPYPTVNETSYGCGFTVPNMESYVRSEYDAWKSTYIVTSENGACVAQPQQGGTCVSEGLGYGMILAAALGDKSTFDSLWQFTKAGADGNGLPNWQFSSGGEVWGEGSATDADVDIALGLLMVSATPILDSKLLCKSCFFL